MNKEHPSDRNAFNENGPSRGGWAVIPNVVARGEGVGRLGPCVARGVLSGCQVLVALILSLLISSYSFPGVATTSAQLPAVTSTLHTQPLPPARFPQDEVPHNDLTEWW